MNDEVASKIVDAYKGNPLLTGILALNVMVFLGLGWFIIQKENKVDRFVVQMHNEMLELAKSCGKGS